MESLPDDLLERILLLTLAHEPHRLHVSHLSLRRVCSRFSAALQNSVASLRDELQTRQARALELIDVCNAVVRDRRAKKRLTMLKQTCQLVVEYEAPPRAAFLHVFRRLFRLLIQQLECCADALLRIAQVTQEVTVNFDIFELTLRRYYEQLLQLFPSDGPLVRPALVIKDPDARKLWVDTLGSDCWYTPWERFRVMLHQVFPASVWARLEFLLHFPKDDMLTTYKFHILVQLFGPFASLCVNFSRYTGVGFLGLINRASAEEILSHYPREAGVFLMRFSRTRPQFLAFSFSSPGSRRVLHTLNCTSSGRTVSVPDKIASDFPLGTFRRVREKLSVEATRMHDISGYASHATRYVTVASLQEEEEADEVLAHAYTAQKSGYTPYQMLDSEEEEDEAMSGAYRGPTYFAQ